MMTEDQKTLEALYYAIQMENDGKEFYLKASTECGNELGKRLFESLAFLEDSHRKKFQQIYENIRESRRWPLVSFKCDPGKILNTVFVEENGKDTSRIRIGLSELDAVKDAMLMEDKSYDLYQQRRKQAEDGDQRSFYEKLLNEEREHKMVLLNYYEYMKDPVSWCVKAERQSFDG